MAKSPSPYTIAQLQARARAGALTAQAAQRVAAAVEAYAQTLQLRLSSLPAGTVAAQAEALKRAREITRGAAQELEKAATAAMAQGRTVAFSEVHGIYQKATLAAAKAAGLPGAALAGVEVPNLLLAGAYENLGGAASTWKKSLTASARASAKEVDAIVKAAIVSNVGPQELARRLYPYVSGAEEFAKAFPKKDDLLKAIHTAQGKLPKELQGAAGRMRSNALRIAYSEIHNARAEAELQAFSVDPLVAAVRWRLSPFRGSQTEPDVCDSLAKADWHGLGPGVYPIDGVPLPPHPRDRCERRPVTRPPSQWADPKPTSASHPRVLKPSAAKILPRSGGGSVTSALAERIRMQLDRGFAALEKHGSPKAIRGLMGQGTSAGAELLEVQKLHQAVLQALQEAAAAPLAAETTVVGYVTFPGKLAGEALESAKALYQKALYNKSAAGLKALQDLGADTTKLSEVIAAKKAKAATLYASKADAKKAAAAAAAQKVAQEAAEKAAQELAEASAAAAQAAKAKKIQDLEADYLAAPPGSAAEKAAWAELNTTGVPLEKKVELMDAKAATVKTQVDDWVVQYQDAAPGSPLEGDLFSQLEKVLDEDELEAVLFQKTAALKTAQAAKLAQAPVPGSSLATMTAAELQEFGKANGVFLVQKKAIQGNFYDYTATLEAALEGDAVAIAKLQKSYGAATVQLEKKLAAQGKLGGGPGAKAIATPEAPPTPPPATPIAAAPAPAKVLDAKTILAQKVGDQAGSNQGGFYLGSDGVKRYVKLYADPSQAHGEVLANQLYRALGLEAPDAVTFVHQGKTWYASTVIDGVSEAAQLGKLGLTSARASKALDGFAADLLTANWDAPGLTLDNLVELPTGKVARIDNGSAFLHRAQGTRKPAAMLNSLTEWEGFTPGPGAKNPQYAQLWTKAGLGGPLDPQFAQRFLDQVDAIVTVRTQAGGWAKYVDDLAPTLAKADRDQVVAMLEARTLALQVKRAEAETLLGPAKAKAATKAAKPTKAPKAIAPAEPMADELLESLTEIGFAAGKTTVQEVGDAMKKAGYLVDADAEAKVAAKLQKLAAPAPGQVVYLTPSTPPAVKPGKVTFTLEEAGELSESQGWVNGGQHTSFVKAFLDAEPGTPGEVFALKELQAYIVDESNAAQQVAQVVTLKAKKLGGSVAAPIVPPIVPPPPVAPIVGQAAPTGAAAVPLPKPSQVALSLKGKKAAGAQQVAYSLGVKVSKEQIGEGWQLQTFKSHLKGATGGSQYSLAKLKGLGADTTLFEKKLAAQIPGWVPPMSPVPQKAAWELATPHVPDELLVSPAKVPGIQAASDVKEELFWNGGNTSVGNLKANGIDLSKLPPEALGFTVDAAQQPLQGVQKATAKVLVVAKKPLIVYGPGDTALEHAIDQVLGGGWKQLPKAKVREALIAEGYDAIVQKGPSVASAVQKVTVLDPKALKIVDQVVVPVPAPGSAPASYAASASAQKIPGAIGGKVTGSLGDARKASARDLSDLPGDDEKTLRLKRQRRSFRGAFSEAERQDLANRATTSIRGSDPILPRLRTWRDTHVQEELQRVLGVDKTRARTIRQKWDKAVAQWFGHSSSDGAAAMKLAAEDAHGLATTTYHGRYFDHDAAQKKRYFVDQAENQLAAYGITRKELLAAYEADEALARASLSEIFGVEEGETFKVWRGTGVSQFTASGQEVPVLGSEVVVTFNSLSSFSVSQPFGREIIAELEATLDDVALQFLTIHTPSHFVESEREVWIIGRPRKMRIVKSPRTS